MRRGLAAAALAALLLAGCAGHHRFGGDPRYGAAMHQRPLVTVKGGVISVSPEPLVFLKDERDIRITWRLPQGATFPDDGIVIEGEVLDPARRGEPLRPGPEAAKVSGPLNRDQREIVDCRVGDDRQTFSCLNRHTRPGVYRYTIRVRVDGKLLVFDPTVMND